MKTSIATVCIAGDLREKLAAIAAAGFDGIEIFEQDFITFDASPREVGAMVRDHGLEISLFQPFRDFEGLPVPDRGRAFERMERKFDLMQELGTDLVLVCSSVHPKALGGIDRMSQDFAELGERAATRNLRVGYEALAWGRHVWDHRDAWEVVRRANHPNIGLVVDSFHTLGRKLDPNSIRAIPGDKIFFVQLADAPMIEMDLLYWSRHFRNMPGQGDLDVTGFMRAVAATGYAGPISLEVFNDQFRGGSPKAIARDGHRSLIYLMDQVRRAEPELHVDLPDIPPRVTSEGVAFVEFAASEAEAEGLRKLLGSLGFRRAGKHISKQVEVWQQGAIRIVLNTDQDGFAHTAHIAHGLNICDVGVLVDSAEDTVSRARALGATPFSQSVGPGEMQIPAIRGVGSGLLHFIDRSSDLGKVWEIEFEPTEGGATHEAGLTRIDHIGQTMNYEEMLTWSLFYLSLFETNKQATVDVVDPGGLVRSQAIESPDAALRVTLNGAETHRTFAGRFIADSFGSSVQHVAFATDDIFACVAEMRKCGFEPLPMPENYYDDLTARLSLSPDFTDRLKADHILYDEDASGSFFQVYTRSVGDGIYLEICQRKDGYTGYGAANAPFRIAAQRRLSRPSGMPRV